MSLVERRRPLLARDLLIQAGLAWLLASTLLLITNAAAIQAGRFPDPDDTLRLVEVRDLIAGQGWFDLTLHRIDALHGGVAMHWSRLVDVPLAGTILLLSPLLGPDLAESSALVLVPLITFGLAMLLAGRIAWRLIGGEATAFAGLVMAMSVPLVGQMRPLRIDHHGWQVVLALLAVNGILARDPRKGGWLAGAALATWLAISLEGLPFAAAFCAIQALRWVRCPADRAWLIAVVQGLALGSALLFAATRGFSDLAPHCDVIAPAHLAALGWGALVLTVLGRMRALNPVVLLGGFVLAAGGAAGIVLQIAPGCAAGSFDMLEPVVRQFWYNNVGEGLPIWRQEPTIAAQTLLPPAIAIWSALQLARTTEAWLRRWWRDYALLLLAALLIAVMVTRAGAVAGALAAVPLGWQLRQWLSAIRKRTEAAPKIAAATGMVLSLLPALPLAVLSMAVPAQAGRQSSGGSPETGKASSCKIPRAAPALRALPTGDILAPLDIGPRLLLETRHTVVATGHHRGHDAMRDTIEAFIGTADTARALVRQRGIEYVVICPDLVEPAVYAAFAPAGFAAQLREGRAPTWLDPVRMPDGVNLKVWRVIR